MNLENFIVSSTDNENYVIEEKVERKTVDDQTVVVKEPRGTYNLPAIYGDRAFLTQRLAEANGIIEIIENFKNNQAKEE